MPQRLTGFSPIVRRQIFDRSGGNCERCGVLTVGNYNIHHRRPRGAGGSRREDTNQAANGLFLCAGCHLWIEVENRTAAKQLGLLISQHRPGITPSEVPVLRRGVWCLLDNSGDYYQIPEPAGGRVA